MRFSTTDGKEYDVPDQCPYCGLSTGGQHGAGCPLNPLRKKELAILDVRKDSP